MNITQTYQQFLEQTGGNVLAASLLVHAQAVSSLASQIENATTYGFESAGQIREGLDKLADKTELAARIDARTR